MNTIKFQCVLDTTTPIESKLLKKRNGKLLVDIQGRLEVLVNGKCFFLEPSLALLEFGIALTKWDREGDFYYYTIEHDEREGPILAFNNKAEKHLSLFSIWQQYESEELLSLNDISESVDSFLLELDQALMGNYGIKINDFIKRRRFFEK
ncbi:hypothetical protein J2S13_003378 [Oikeobacillus pervagus]|uniref:DUF7878 domain-containing protein n=1 Tax=Oikeobacillus pervagus TaxID=1325931 RepID=A0AAJ1T1H5_9BACI|nr:hypothetical protein [Oikeobacillus pervagus]MDQ0216880.1 hypothetical protein [Oikeobacillus pervagus]